MSLVKRANTDEAILTSIWDQVAAMKNESNSLLYQLNLPQNKFCHLRGRELGLPSLAWPQRAVDDHLNIEKKWKGLKQITSRQHTVKEL